MTFLHKSVGDEPLLFGSDLRDLRELHSISFEQACAETKIDASVLQAFESDRVGDLPDPIFSKRHLIAYVRYLGGYEPYFVSRYEAKLEALNAHRTVKDVLPQNRPVRFFELFVAPQFLAFSGIVVLAVLLGGYIFWQARTMNTPPPLSIIAPFDGERLTRPRVTVEGETIPEAMVTVNDRSAAVDQQGRFSIQLDVRRGTTVIHIVARRRRGSETVEERRVVFDREILDPSAVLNATSSAPGISATTSTE